MSTEFEAKERREKEGYARGEYGPTWYDVRKLASAMEDQYGVRIQFVIDPAHLTHRYRMNHLHIRVKAHRRQDPETAPAWASASMGGNSGSKTMPASMYHALLNLDAILAGTGTQGEDPFNLPLWG